MTNKENKNKPEEKEYTELELIKREKCAQEISALNAESMLVNSQMQVAVARFKELGGEVEMQNPMASSTTPDKK